MQQFSKFFYETLLEKRRSEKLTVMEQLDKYRDDPNVFITFTSDFDGHAKFGINPGSTYGTPIGIYSYPLKVYYDTIASYFNIPYQREKPNIFVFKPKNPQKILFDSKFTIENLRKYFPQAKTSIKLEELLKNPKNYLEEISSFMTTLIDYHYRKEYRDIAPVRNMCYEIGDNFYMYVASFDQHNKNTFFKFPKDIKKLEELIRDASIAEDDYMSLANKDDILVTKLNVRDDIYSIVINHLSYVRNKPLAVYILDYLSNSTLAKDHLITEQEYYMAIFSDKLANDKEKSEKLQVAYKTHLNDMGYDYRKTPLQALLTETRNLANANPRKWTLELLKLGIEGVVDDTGTGIIHTSEPYQGAFFRTTDLQVLDLIKHVDGKNWKKDESKLTEFRKALDQLVMSLTTEQHIINKEDVADKLTDNFKLKKFIYRVIYYTIREHLIKPINSGLSKNLIYSRKLVEKLGKIPPPKYLAVKDFLFNLPSSDREQEELVGLDKNLSIIDGEERRGLFYIMKNLSHIERNLSIYSTERFIKKFTNFITYVASGVSPEEYTLFNQNIKRYFLESLDSDKDD